MTGLNKDQVKTLREDHHIYMTSNGKINLSGVTEENMDYVATAIIKVTK